MGDFNDKFSQEENEEKLRNYGYGGRNEGGEQLNELRGKIEPLYNKHNLQKESVHVYNPTTYLQKKNI